MRVGGVTERNNVETDMEGKSMHERVTGREGRRESGRLESECKIT
jgi:hypothetical protein